MMQGAGYSGANYGMQGGAYYNAQGMGMMPMGQNRRRGGIQQKLRNT